MSKRLILIALLLTFVAAEADAQNRKYRRRGVILGGLAGAALGVAIGDKGDNETAGALIGGAVGAFAGGTIGNQKDQRIEHNQRHHSGYQSYYQPPVTHQPYRGQYQAGEHVVPPYHQPYYHQPVESAPYQPRPVIIDQSPRASVTDQPVTVNDVLAMRRSGLSDQVILRQINLRGVGQTLSVAEILRLHQAGVSEDVLVAMQEAVYDVHPQSQNQFGPSVISPAN